MLILWQVRLDIVSFNGAPGQPCCKPNTENTNPSGEPNDRETMRVNGAPDRDASRDRCGEKQGHFGQPKPEPVRTGLRSIWRSRTWQETLPRRPVTSFQLSRMRLSARQANLPSMHRPPQPMKSTTPPEHEALEQRQVESAGQGSIFSLKTAVARRISRCSSGKHRAPPPGDKQRNGWNLGDTVRLIFHKGS